MKEARNVGSMWRNLEVTANSAVAGFVSAMVYLRITGAGS